MIRLKLFQHIMGFLMWVTSGKCRYYDVCKLRNPEQPACTNNRGQYYEFGKYPGCYRAMEKKRHERV